MVNQFEYKGFEPTDQMRVEAEEVLDHIMDEMKNVVTLVGRLDYNGHYFCEIDVILRRGSIFASASHTDPIEAVRHAGEIILKRLAKAKDTPFYRRWDVTSDRVESAC